MNIVIGLCDFKNRHAAKRLRATLFLIIHPAAFPAYGILKSGKIKKIRRRLLEALLVRNR
jgi:hypothetical protein